MPSVEFLRRQSDAFRSEQEGKLQTNSPQTGTEEILLLLEGFHNKLQIHQQLNKILKSIKLCYRLHLLLV